MYIYLTDHCPNEAFQGQYKQIGTKQRNWIKFF